MGKGKKKKNEVAFPWEDSAGGGDGAPTEDPSAEATKPVEDFAPEPKSDTKAADGGFDWLGSNDDTSAWGSKPSTTKKKDKFGAFDSLGGTGNNDYLNSFNIGTAVTGDTSNFDWFDSTDKGAADALTSTKKEEDIKSTTTSSTSKDKKKKNKAPTESAATEIPSFAATSSFWDTGTDDKDPISNTNNTFSWDNVDSGKTNDTLEEPGQAWGASTAKKKKSKKGDDKADTPKETATPAEPATAPEDDWMSWGGGDKGGKKGKKGKSIFGASSAVADTIVPPVPPVPPIDESNNTKDLFDYEADDTWGTSWTGAAPKKGKTGKDTGTVDNAKLKAGFGKSNAVADKYNVDLDDFLAEPEKPNADFWSTPVAKIEEVTDPKPTEAAGKKAKKKGKKNEVEEKKDDALGDDFTVTEPNGATDDFWGNIGTGKSKLASGKTDKSEKIGADLSTSGVLRPDEVVEPKGTEAAGKKGKKKPKKNDPVEIKDETLGDSNDIKEQPTAIDEPDFGSGAAADDTWGWAAPKKDKKDGKKKVNGLAVTEEKPTQGTVKSKDKEEHAATDFGMLDEPKDDDPWAFWGSAKKGAKPKGKTGASEEESLNLEDTPKADKKSSSKTSAVPPPPTDKESKKASMSSTGNSIADRIKKLEDKKAGKKAAETPAEPTPPPPPPIQEVPVPEPENKTSKLSGKKKDAAEKAKVDKGEKADKGGKTDKGVKEASAAPGGFPSLMDDDFGFGVDKKNAKKTKKSTEEAKKSEDKDDAIVEETKVSSLTQDKADKGKTKSKSKIETNALEEPTENPVKDKSKLGESKATAATVDKAEKSKGKSKSKVDTSLADEHDKTSVPEKTKVEEVKVSSAAEKGDKGKLKNKVKTDAFAIEDRDKASNLEKVKSGEAKASSLTPEKDVKAKSKGKPKGEATLFDDFTTEPVEDVPKPTVASSSWGFWGSTPAEEPEVPLVPVSGEKADKKEKKKTATVEAKKPTEAVKVKASKAGTEKAKTVVETPAPPPPPPPPPVEPVKRGKTAVSKSAEKASTSKSKDIAPSKAVPPEEEQPAARPANPKRSSFMGFFAGGASTPAADNEDDPLEAAGTAHGTAAEKTRSTKSMEPEMSAKAAKVLGIRTKGEKASQKPPAKKSGVKDFPNALLLDPEPVSIPPKPKRTPSKAHSTTRPSKRSIPPSEPPSTSEQTTPPVTGTTSSNRKSAGMGFFGNLMSASRPGGLSRRNSEAGPRTRDRGNSLAAEEEEEAKQARREARRRKRESAAIDQPTSVMKGQEEEDDAARRARRAERKARKEAELLGQETKSRSRRTEDPEADDRARREEKRRKREAVDRALEERQRKSEKHRGSDPDRSSRKRPDAERRHTTLAPDEPYDEDRAARKERRARRESSDARPRTERRRTTPAGDLLNGDENKDPEAFRRLKVQDTSTREAGGKKHMSKWINSLEQEPPEPPPLEGTVLDESGQKPRKVTDYEDTDVREKERKRDRRKSTREPVAAEPSSERPRHRRRKSSYANGYGDEDGGGRRDGSSGSPKAVDEYDFGAGGGGKSRRTPARRDSYVDAGVVDEAEDAYRTAENGAPDSRLGKSSWWKGARAKMGII